MSTTSPQDFLPFSTAAIDFHRALNLPTGPLVTSREELDSLHAHLVAVQDLLDAHTDRTGRLLAAEADQLSAARTRVWQAADHVHGAYHAAPRPGTGDAPEEEAARPSLPEGAPELTICQRHQRASHRIRRSTTPADLHAPFTGLNRH